VPEWDAEVVVDEGLVHALLAEQFPELDGSSARLLGEGWDNSVWVVEERWAFRFPRRDIAIPGVQRELAVLPALAPVLPTPIPVPRFVGEPSDRFPWPFVGAELLSGIEPCDAELSDDDREKLGGELGRFLRVLHELNLDLALPVDPLGRGDMSRQVTMSLELAAKVGWLEIDRTSLLFARALELDPPSVAVLVHGDLHLRHVLVEHGALAGVIDWGDVCVGDPSIDLQIAWSLLPIDARARFFDEYGPIDEECELRARVLAVRLSAVLAYYARSVGYATLEREALAGFYRAVAD
jgi:aminoglycoside phosphotransferase (APT) family kinase protein